MTDIKIAILTPQSLPVVGGLQIVVDALARGISGSGHQARLFTPTAPDNSPLPYPVIQIKDLPPFYPIPLKNMPILERGIDEFLDREYRREPFDILHAHMTYPTGFSALFWGKKRGVPVLITSHGIDVIARPQDGYGFLLDEHLKNKISECLRSATALSIVSHHLKDHLLSLGAAADTIHTIPNGVDTDRFRGAGEDCDHPYILAMGCLHRIKGFDLLLDALESAVKRVPGINLKIAGEGPDREMLIEKTLRMGMGGNVEFLPFISGEEKIGCISGCRYVVCPSRYESFGMVALEAWAAGKPVLGFDVGGLSELVRHGENGLLVPPEDVDSLCDGMLKLWGREVRLSYTRLIETARAYDWKTITDKYLSLYQSL